MYEHGGNIYKYENILDFSANINPLGMPEAVKNAVEKAVVMCENYPDPKCRKLSEKLALSEQIHKNHIVCGNGAADLIYRTVNTVKPKKAVICAPTFSEYKKALYEANCLVSEYTLSEEKDFILDKNFLKLLTKDIDIVFICTPNNPTGKLIPVALLYEISEKCFENEIILVCDECFLGFVENSTEYSLRHFFHESCVILNAFTKLYAMPGIRLGYALFGSAALADKVRKNGQCWGVSVLAQAAGIAAFDEKEYTERTVKYIKEEREFIAKSLSEIDVKVYESAANFMLIKTYADLDKDMKKQGILIRECANFHGLDSSYFRIAVRMHEENIRLINAVRRCING